MLSLVVRKETARLLKVYYQFLLIVLSLLMQQNSMFDGCLLLWKILIENGVIRQMNGIDI